MRLCVSSIHCLFEIEKTLKRKLIDQGLTFGRNNDATEKIVVAIWVQAFVNGFGAFVNGFEASVNRPLRHFYGNEYIWIQRYEPTEKWRVREAGMTDRTVRRSNLDFR